MAPRRGGGDRGGGVDRSCKEQRPGGIHHPGVVRGLHCVIYGDDWVAVEIEGGTVVAGRLGRRPAGWGCMATSWPRPGGGPVSASQPVPLIHCHDDTDSNRVVAGVAVLAPHVLRLLFDDGVVRDLRYVPGQAQGSLLRGISMTPTTSRWFRSIPRASTVGRECARLAPTESMAALAYAAVA